MKRFYRWLPALLVAALIFLSSAQTYQQQDMRPVIAQHVDEKKVEQAFSKVQFQYGSGEVSVANKGAAGFLEFFMRKAAHFGVYLVLALCVVHALYMTMKRRLAYGLAWGLAVLYAISDEVHQYFTGDRTPMYQDVLVDACGAAAGIALYAAVQAVLQRRAKHLQFTKWERMTRFRS